MREALATWFDRCARTLPWRGARRDPYAVLVSEVMLQQTRVETVVPYFERWMQRFPTVRSLADADEETVLRLWQGLGYYRRARRLQEAARQIEVHHGGRIPDSRDELEALPGVGRYSAAAIAALAFGDDVIAVDGNVRRVAARLFGWREARADRAIERALAERFAPSPAPGDTGHGPAAGAPEPPPLAEALIELGALVCTPREPRCEACPLASGCRARAAGAPEAYPRPGHRRAPPRRRRFALVALEGCRVWLRRRGTDEMLGGLWGFPQCDAAPAGARCLDPVAHAYSHFRLELVPVLVDPTHPALQRAGPARAWHVDELAVLPLSSVDLRVLERLRREALLPDAAVS